MHYKDFFEMNGNPTAPGWYWATWNIDGRGWLKEVIFLSTSPDSPGMGGMFTDPLSGVRSMCSVKDLKGYKYARIPTEEQIKQVYEAGFNAGAAAAAEEITSKI